MGSSMKGGSTTVGYRYYMTIQYGLCRGPINEIKQIVAGDKEIWPNREGESAYDSTITDDRVTSIEAPSIFGGDKSEGGIQGSLTALMGKITQVYPTWVKALLGGDVPDFRGVATVVFDGLICSLNPYPKEWKFRLRRTTAGWDGSVWQPGLATIWLDDNKIMGMNGAHILYECVTNRQWGKGYDRSRIGETSWVAAARTLYNEGFGLCMKWNRQDSLQSFVQEVLDHIGATLYTNRETGLLDLKLIRDDYNVDDLPLFDKNSGLISVEQAETATLTDAVGEIIVKYHSVLTNEDLEVRAQNLALTQAAEGSNSKTNTYAGIPIQSLAARVAQRDLRAVSSAINRYTVKLDRRAWRIFPGAVFRISDPDQGIENLVLRAGKVEDGTFTSGTITVEAAMDVFGLSSTSFISTEEGGWTPPSATPVVLTNRQVYEATYRDAVLRLDAANLAILDVNSTALAMVASRTQGGLMSYAIGSRTGSEPFNYASSENFTPMALCNGSLGYYNGTLIFDGALDPGLMQEGVFLLIDDEILYVTDITVNEDGVSGEMSILRGCIDTIPAPHADNSHIFFLLNDFIGTDYREYVTGETVDVKLLSNTSSAQLDETLAPTDTVTMVGRQGRPYPPGAVFVDWTPAFNGVAASTSFRIDWTHRDRKTQADQAVGHWDANVGPEAGVTYTLRFLTSSNVIIRTIAGITDNFRLFTSDDTDLTGSMFVELWAVRDGISSFQKYRFAMSRSI